jgi:hypothetical protein
VRRGTVRCAVTILVVVIVLLVAADGSVAGAMSSRYHSVRRHQTFVGTVNGLASDAMIKVLCPGPANSGHALSGQTLAVARTGPSSATPGSTGSRASAIIANLAITDVTASLATLRKYGSTAPFPTSLSLPCSGSGVVSFDPTPGSASGVAYDVTVTFENVGTDVPDGHAQVLPVVTEKTPPQCTGGQIRVRATTNHDTYPLGHTVAMTSSISNVSPSPCTIFLGAVAGWSPSFTVTNKKGTVVWDRCWVQDQPGACATVLRSFTLRAGQRYKQRATWDQRSGADGHTPVQVHRGQYTFSTHYQYMPGTALTQFTIC